MPFIKNHQTGRLLENINVLFESSVPPYYPALILINLNENATMLFLLSQKPSMSPISHFCVLPSPVANWNQDTILTSVFCVMFKKRAGVFYRGVATCFLLLPLINVWSPHVLLIFVTRVSTVGFIPVHHSGAKRGKKKRLFISYLGWPLFCRSWSECEFFLPYSRIFLQKDI